MKNCVRCKAPINESQDWQQVVGWQKAAKAASRKGGYDVILRKTVDEWMCAGCAHMEKLGIPVGQETLLGGEAA